MVDGDGHKEDISQNILDSQTIKSDHPLDWNQIENAMRQQAEMINALKALIEVGELEDKKTAPGLGIRGYIPSNITPGVVRATALTQMWSKSIEFSDICGQQEIVMWLATQAGVDGKRSELVVKAVTGSFIGKRDESLGGKAKRAAFGEHATE